MENNQKTALISVFNKDGIIEFAESLIDLGWKIIASGGIFPPMPTLPLSIYGL